MPRKRLSQAFTGWLFCAIASATLAGPSPRFTVDVFGTEKGLPQSSVLTMTLARDGYLWVGTLNGLARFDGSRFTVFDESNTRGLNSSRIFRLFEDSRQNLWIGTENSGVVLARKDGSILPVGIGQGSAEGSLMAACEDAAGSVWLYTANGQLARYRDKQVTVWNAGEGSSLCRALVADDAGLLWLGNDRGLTALGPMSTNSAGMPVAHEFLFGNDLLAPSKTGGFWRLGQGQVQKWKGARAESAWPYPWRAGVHVSAACEDQEGNLIVGTYGDGVYWFDSSGRSVRIEGLPHSYIWSLVMDREGSLWVGTDGSGLNRVKRQIFEILAGSLGATVQSAAPDGTGGLWVAYNGERIEHWRDGLAENYSLHEPPVELSARAVFVDRTQRVWVATHTHGLFQFQNGAFRRVGPEVLYSGNAAIYKDSAIYQDRAGLIWVGTEGGLARWDERDWKVFTTRDGLSANGVQAIADDAEGNLWVGTDWGGLNRLRDGKFTAFTKTNGLPSNNVSSLYVDEAGVLWAGTSGGLARFQQAKWTRYGKEQGLVNNSVGYLLDDAQGDLWLGSTAGLIRAPKATLNQFAAEHTNVIPWRTYSAADGLPSGECTSGSQPAACRTSDGKLWFPTIRGLALLDPALLRINTNQLPVIIESVLIEGEPQQTNDFRSAPLSRVVMPAGKERLEIHYTSLNLAARDRARFRYRMEGHETAWTETEAGSLPVAYYSKLPPGDYRFRVTACNEDGVWNENGTSLDVKVLPPFWRTWWFMSSAALVLLGLIVGSVHYVSTQRLHRELEGLRQQEALERERARIARDLHDQLGANLTQIALVGELAETDKDQPEEVEAHARQICQTARDTTRSLDEIVWTVNPSNDTLDGLINYVCKYAQEYLEVAGVRYRLDVPAQLPATPISPELRHNVFLAAKEAITNVVRHARASSASLRLRLEPRRFTIELEDNGRGLAGFDEKAAASRNGLRNMRKRMEDVGGSFSIDPGAGGGAVVRLSAPLGDP